ncbi:hypothetical protein [Aldersonia kunmingensis]|uniref:hypothetical protein n=1 Tax=Aldersonia kunmingensis TaxID=408066 RepID=UPI0012EDA827|nr:hypothetical protein [Aldersonia kunmingensis]
MLLDASLAKSERDRLVRDSERAEDALTSLHRKKFPVESKPEEPEIKREWQRGWIVTNKTRVGQQSAYESAFARWRRLQAHDPEEVIRTVDAAFADNVSHSACVDAGTDGGINYVTLVVHFPGEEVAHLAIADGGKVRKRSKSEVIDLYRRALASTIIATVKEALSSAPVATHAKIVVFSYPLTGFLKTRQQSELTPIYAATFDRGTLTKNRLKHTPVAEIMAADDLLVATDRFGRFKPLGDRASDDIRLLAATLVATHTHAAGRLQVRAGTIPPGRK